MPEMVGWLGKKRQRGEKRDGRELLVDVDLTTLSYNSHAKFTL